MSVPHASRSGNAVGAQRHRLAGLSLRGAGADRRAPRRAVSALRRRRPPRPPSLLRHPPRPPTGDPRRLPTRPRTQGRRGILDDRDRIPGARRAGLQPHPAAGRMPGRPGHPAVAVCEADRPPASRQQLPARIGGRRRALRALLVHRPAGAHGHPLHGASTIEVLARRQGDRTRTTAIRSSSSTPTRSASRWRCAPGCRAFAAGSPAISPTTRCATSSRAPPGATSPIRSACPTCSCCSPKSWRSSTTSAARST